MHERVAGLRGTFSLHSAPGQGTEIRIRLNHKGHEGHKE